MTDGVIDNGAGLMDAGDLTDNPGGPPPGVAVGAKPRPGPAPPAQTKGELPTRPAPTAADTLAEIDPVEWPESITVVWHEVALDPPVDLTDSPETAEALTSTYWVRDAGAVYEWVQLYLLVGTPAGAVWYRRLIEAALEPESLIQFRADLLSFGQLALRRWPTQLQSERLFALLSTQLVGPLGRISTPKESPPSSGQDGTGGPSQPVLMTNRQLREHRARAAAQPNDS